MKIIEMDNSGKTPANYTGIIVRTQTETKYWYKDGKHHREDGPAIECADGHKEWWVKGRRHRLDGLAIEYPDGSGQWFIYGKQYSKINQKIMLFLAMTRENMKSCGIDFLTRIEYWITQTYQD